MAGADLVIHDAQYTPEEYGPKKNWGHSTYDYAVRIAAAAGVKRLALTHHDPMHDDNFVADIEQRARALAVKIDAKIDVFCAYEGCEITLERGDSLTPFVSTDTAQTSVARRGFNILAVDDQPEMLAIVVMSLEDDQHTVSQATSGAEALDMIDAEMPDLVVLDYKMAQMDGLAVVKSLRANPRTQHLPVLMLTGMGDESSTRAGFEAGATDYLTKPFSIPQLSARVRMCMARAKAAR
jgi:CheY-like chemotaxis protein